MTFLYSKLAAAGILGGCVMIFSGLEMYWQGAASALVGLLALSLGIGNVIRARKSLAREEVYDLKGFSASRRRLPSSRGLAARRVAAAVSGITLPTGGRATE